MQVEILSRLDKIDERMSSMEKYVENKVQLVNTKLRAIKEYFQERNVWLTERVAALEKNQNEKEKEQKKANIEVETKLRYVKPIDVEKGEVTEEAVNQGDSLVDMNVDQGEAADEAENVDEGTSVDDDKYFYSGAISLSEDDETTAGKEDSDHDSDNLPLTVVYEKRRSKRGPFLRSPYTNPTKKPKKVTHFDDFDPLREWPKEWEMKLESYFSDDRRKPVFMARCEVSKEWFDEALNQGKWLRDSVSIKSSFVNFLYHL